jgi:hypothetical protein
MEAQMKSILDPSFRYTKSAETDLRKTFARVRRELRKQRLEQSPQSFDDPGNILPFPPGEARRNAFGREVADVPPGGCVDQAKTYGSHDTNRRGRH